MGGSDQPTEPTPGSEKLQTLSEYAAELRKSLPKARGSRPNDLLLADLQRHSNIATSLAQSPPKHLGRTSSIIIERHGRELWNLCIRLKRNAIEIDSQVLLWTRVFSFALLCLGRAFGRRRAREVDIVSEVSYLTTNALFLARLCLDAGDTGAASCMLQKAAELLESLKRVGEGVTAGTRRIKLEADYYALRIVLSWRQDMVDVAEHMFVKTEALLPHIDVSSAEMMADTLRHIGSDLFSKNDFPLAIQWLERAYSVIASQELRLLTAQGLENRIAICHALIQSYLRLNTPHAVQKAETLVSQIENKADDRPVILHWMLEILQATSAEVFDVEKYYCILRRMVRIFDSSDDTFMFLLHHIKELRTKNRELAITLLDEFLVTHMLQTGKSEWLNKAFVTRIRMSTVEAGFPDAHSFKDTLNDLLDTISDVLSEPLSPDAAGAAHAEKVVAAMANQQYIEAGEWCMTALHELFTNSGADNLAKFGRKQILCALELNDAARARAVFDRLPTAARSDPLAQFLMFKVSLLDWDHHLGFECIASLARTSAEEDEDDVNNNSREMLYACIREAREIGDEICTSSALKAIIESWNPEKAYAANLPSIIRCRIRLLIRMEGNDIESTGGYQHQSSVDDLCTMFEQALQFARRKPLDAGGKPTFTVPELTWFRKNAYNIGAYNIEKWNLGTLIRIFTACLGFIDSFPADIAKKESEELRLMAVRCHFTIAAAMVAMARATAELAEQMERYLETRHHAIAVYHHLGEQAVTCDVHITRDLCLKLGTMTVFDFEAAVALKSWDDLNTIVQRAASCGDEAILKAMADLLLRSQPPGKVMSSTLSLIVNRIFALMEFDIEQLAKYFRCIYQATLPLDDESALQLLTQILEYARQSAEAKKPLPAAELEWLVAKSFNQALDFHAHKEEGKCHQWALQAINLATFMEDDAQYRSVLSEKFAKLHPQYTGKLDEQVESSQSTLECQRPADESGHTEDEYTTPSQKQYL